MKNVNVCARSLNDWVLGILKDCRISKRLTTFGGHNALIAVESRDEIKYKDKKGVRYELVAKLPRR